MAEPAALSHSVHAISRSAALTVVVLLAVADHAKASPAGVAENGWADCLPGALPAAVSNGRYSKVRGLDMRARELLQRATQASRTVTALIAALDRTDVLVLVQVTFTPKGHAGERRFGDDDHDDHGHDHDHDHQTTSARSCRSAPTCTTSSIRTDRRPCSPDRTLPCSCRGPPRARRTTGRRRVVASSGRMASSCRTTTPEGDSEAPPEHVPACRAGPCQYI
jgi:hypothetical protein